MWFLLGEDYESDELLSADLRKALTFTLLPQIAHEVKDRLATQNLVAHVSTHHDGRLVMQDGGGVAWPDGQPRIDGTGSVFHPKSNKSFVFHHRRFPINTPSKN